MSAPSHAKAARTRQIMGKLVDRSDTIDAQRIEKALGRMTIRELDELYYALVGALCEAFNKGQSTTIVSPLLDPAWAGGKDLIA